MGFEIILCDGEADTSTFAPPENTRLSGLSRISDRRLKSNHRKANQSVQRPAFACAKSFSLHPQGSWSVFRSLPLF